MCVWLQVITLVNVYVILASLSPIATVRGRSLTRSLLTTAAGACSDIDECLVNNGGCDAVSVCYNTPGDSSLLVRSPHWI